MLHPHVQYQDSTLYEEPFHLQGLPMIFPTESMTSSPYTTTEAYRRYRYREDMSEVGVTGRVPGIWGE